MSLNIQNLINRINNKVSALDSNSDLTDIIRLNDLSNRISGDINEGAVRYRSSGQLPSTSLSDSAYDGQIAFVEDQQLDSNGRYFFRTKNGWINLNTLTDSDEDILIASGGGVAATWPGTTSTYAGDFNHYLLGGGPINPAPTQHGIQKFSVASDTNATKIGNIDPTYDHNFHIGGGSTTHGYAIGLASFTSGDTDIYKFSYASDGDATQPGHSMAPPSPSYKSTTHTEMIGNRTYIYTAGGHEDGPPAFPSPGIKNRILKFAAASEANGTDVGDMITSIRRGGGQSSTTHGYHSGGDPGPVNTIQKWPFSSDTNASDVGDMTVVSFSMAASSSSDHGYNTGGLSPPAPGSVLDVIDRFSFSSDGNSTDVGDFSNAVYFNTGTSSSTHGYSNGGQYPSPLGGASDAISKFAYSASVSIVDVGDLTKATTNAGGTMN